MLPEARRILALRNPQTKPIPFDTRLLRPIQIRALSMVATVGGLLGIIGVGNGKTLISLLSPSVYPCRRPLLLVPPSLVSQTKREIYRWKDQFPIHPDLQVMSYTELSTVAGSARFLALSPDFIVADEAHNLRRVDSARTRRLIDWFQRNPQTRFVALSGTLASKSLKDFDHLAELALRNRSPLPCSWLEIEAWAACCDADPEAPPTEYQLAAFEPIRAAFPAESDRQSFFSMLSKSPGVICTTQTSAAECSLRVQFKRLLAPVELIAELQKLRASWTLPTGDELLRAVEFSAAVRQLRSGFVYTWEWGTAGKNHPWLEARAAWARVVRATLAQRMRGIDSPFQVEQFVSQTRYGAAFQALEAWTYQAEETPQPPQVSNWVTERWLRKIVDVVRDFETDRGPVLVWTEHAATQTALGKLGLEIVSAGSEIPTGKPRTLVLSRKSHGIGKNLQAWNTCVLAEIPSSGEAWEQLLGRCHREGQEAEDVLFCVPWWDASTQADFESALEEARFMQEVTGQPQKLLLASHEFDFGG